MKFADNILSMIQTNIMIAFFFFRTGDSLDMFVINIYNYILLFLKKETASIAYIIIIFIYNNTLFL